MLVFTRHLAVCLICAAAVRADASQFSLKAVAKGGASITPTNSVTASPGDQIVTEIFLSEWARDLPSGVRIMQARLDGNLDFISGGRGTVLPCHWDGPWNPVGCSSPSQCPPQFPICWPQHGCGGPDRNPPLCAFIEEDRPDFVLFGLGTITIVDTSTLNYRFGSVADDAVGVADPGHAVYCGTLILDVSLDACGTFVIGFTAGESFIADNGFDPRRVEPTLEPLTITLPACPPKAIGCQPEHCTIDARIPHHPDFPGVRLNDHIVVMSFTSSTAGMTTSDFQVTIDPDDDFVPGVADVLVSDASATIVLNQRIPAEHYTCIRHIESDWQCCLGSLPADADWNGTSDANDVAELLDNLTGVFVPPLLMVRCDTDRSELCTGADLLRAVDLLVGVDSFAPTDGDALTPCPPN